MKSREEVEALKEGDLLYDKMTRDQHGKPLVWKVAGPLRQARNNPDYWIRQIELVEEEEKPVEGPDAEAQRGYHVINPENMEQLCSNEDIAEAYFILWDLEDGITEELRDKLWNVVDRIIQSPTVGQRFKGLDLL